MKKALFDNATKYFQSLVRQDIPTGDNYVLVSEEEGQTLTNLHKYLNGNWVLAGPDPVELWRAIKNERNLLLEASDWTQLPDVPLDTKEAWADYRQELRDITNQPDPFNIVWPIPPA